MALKDVIGQDRALDILRGSVARGRIAHAYLFTGQEGVGKRFTALNIAKMLNCQQPVMQPAHLIDCCDRCNSCLKIERGIHPDVIIIEPKEGQIRVDTIRELERSISYRPFEGNWKVAIIDGAESFNPSASNAFLKTLEEPPAHSILILLSSIPELIPSTIRSRCQRLHFSPLPIENMMEFLKEKGIQDGLLGILSGGSLGRILTDDLLSKREWSFQGLKSLLGDIEGLDIWEDRTSIEEWFDWIFVWLRDIAVFKSTGNAGFLINRDKEAEIREISEGATLRDILRLSEELYTIKDQLRFNLNKQILLYYISLLLKNVLRPHRKEEDIDC